MTDNEHALFVRQPFRYEDVADFNVSSRNPSAREVVLETNMDQANAVALATAYLNANKQPRAFEIRLVGRVDMSEFIGGPPSWLATDPRLATDAKERTVISYNYSDKDNETVVVVRG